MLSFGCGRSDVLSTIRSESGLKKAENLFKELMMKISEVSSVFSSQSAYVLEQMLDFTRASNEFKVHCPVVHCITQDHRADIESPPRRSTGNRTTRRQSNSRSVKSRTG